MNRTITNEEINLLPLINFKGDIVVVDSLAQIEEVVSELSSTNILGFDTETKPAFKKGTFHKVALLQLATANRVFLIRLNIIGLPMEIVKILELPNIVKAGAAIRDDIKALQKWTSFKAQGFVELQNLAKEKGMVEISLKKLSAILLYGKMSKRQRLSNWEEPELTEGQQLYAATDAWASYKIYNTLIFKPTLSVSTLLNE